MEEFADQSGESSHLMYVAFRSHLFLQQTGVLKAMLAKADKRKDVSEALDNLWTILKGRSEALYEKRVMQTEKTNEAIRRLPSIVETSSEEATSSNAQNLNDSGDMQNSLERAISGDLDEVAVEELTQAINISGVSLDPLPFANLSSILSEISEFIKLNAKESATAETTDISLQEKLHISWTILIAGLRQGDSVNRSYTLLCLQNVIGAIQSTIFDLYIKEVPSSIILIINFVREFLKHFMTQSSPTKDSKTELWPSFCSVKSRLVSVPGSKMTLCWQRVSAFLPKFS